jgi:hypothetical protein
MLSEIARYRTMKIVMWISSSKTASNKALETARAARCLWLPDHQSTVYQRGAKNIIQSDDHLQSVRIDPAIELTLEDPLGLLDPELQTADENPVIYSLTPS